METMLEVTSFLLDSLLFFPTVPIASDGFRAKPYLDKGSNKGSLPSSSGLPVLSSEAHCAHGLVFIIQFNMCGCVCVSLSDLLF